MIIWHNNNHWPFIIMHVKVSCYLFLFVLERLGSNDKPSKNQIYFWQNENEYR